jgi:hypothetical protein
MSFNFTTQEKSETECSPFREKETEMILTEGVKDFLTRLRDNRSLNLVDRREDRIRQKARRYGLAQFGGGKWHITVAGLRELKDDAEREERAARTMDAMTK